MGFAERLLDFLRRAPPSKKKSQIACAFRPGNDGIVQPGGDRQFGDPRNRTSGTLARDALQNSALGNGNHHDAGGNSFTRRIPSGELQRMSKKQLFESDWVACPVKAKSQGPSAEPADRPGRDFQRPHGILVDAKLRVDWSMRQTQSSRCISRASLDGALHGFGKTRRCDVDGFFEVRAFERIGFIKDRQYAQSTIREKSFDCNFPPWYVTYHQHVIELSLASSKNLRGFEQPPDTCGCREKLLAIVCAHDALTSRNGKRFPHTGTVDPQQLRRGSGCHGKMPKPRNTQPGISKDSFHAQLAPASFHCGRMAVTDSQTPRGVGGSGSGPVTQSKNPAVTLAAQRLHHCIRGYLWGFEMHGVGLIAPRILQLVALIGDVMMRNAQRVRGILKTSRLVTEFSGEEQQSFGRIRHL